ncbi:hypothetical protein EMIT079MI2_30130 [Bacillus sp. IT-79MI2]
MFYRYTPTETLAFSNHNYSLNRIGEYHVTTAPIDIPLFSIMFLLSSAQKR